MERSLRKIPAISRARIVLAIQSMAENPFEGDIVRLKGSMTWRKRVGDFRVFFEVDFEAHAVDVLDVQRRTSTTY